MVQARAVTCPARDGGGDGRAEIARPESHDFDAGVAAPVGFAPVAVRRAVSSGVLGGGAEVGVGRTARAGVGAAPAGIAGRAACFAAAALFGCACSGVGVRGAVAFASAGRLPLRARSGGRLGSWRSSPSLRRPPPRLAPGVRRAAPASCAGPRARAAPGAAPAPVGTPRRWSPSARNGRRRAGAPGRPAAPAPDPGRPAPGGSAGRSCRPPLRGGGRRSLRELPPPHRIQHQRRLRVGGARRYGRRGVCRRIGLCRRPCRC